MEENELFNSDLGLPLRVSDLPSQIQTTDQTHPPHWKVPPPNSEFPENNSDDDEEVPNSDSDFIPSEQEDEDGGPIPGPEQKRKRGRPPNSKNKATITRDSNNTTASNICKTCNKSFTAITSLRRHELTHSENNQRFTCEECGKKFTQKPSLVTHIKTQHLGELNFPCGHCDKIYVRNCELQGHIRRCHQLGPKLREKCPECKKEYVKLKQHIREVHKSKEKSRKHKCNICDKSFAHGYVLTRHVKLHNMTDYESLTLTCPHCPAKFSMKYRLDRHISKTHLAEKKIVSKYCGMKFKYYGARKIHDEIHKKKGICSKTGVSRRKLFACEFCPERAETEYLLKLHMKKTHPQPRLILKKMAVKNISLKENPDSGLFLVRPEKEAKDSGSVCAWHLCLKCGTAFLDLNRARRHNNFCEFEPHHAKSDNNPTAATVSAENENRNPDGDPEIDPHLTSTEPVSRPIKTEIMDSYDEGVNDFEGVFIKDEVTDILSFSNDADGPNYTNFSPSDTRRKISETRDRSRNSDEVEDGGDLDLGQSEPVTPMVTKPRPSQTPTPSIPGRGQKRKTKLPAALRATTPWREKHMNVTSEIENKIVSGITSMDGDTRISNIEPPLTSSEPISTRVEAEIINSGDDDEGRFDFEGTFTEDEVTDIIIDSSIDTDGPDLPTPSTTQLVLSETNVHSGDPVMVENAVHIEMDHSEPFSSTLKSSAKKPVPSQSHTPAPSTATPEAVAETPNPAPSIPVPVDKKKSKLPAALRATTPWQEKHMNVVLSAPNPFQCKTCLKFFASKNGVLSHVKIHAEPEHCCEYCGQRFTVKVQWIYHVRTHTGEKPHKCKFCDYRARIPMVLAEHEKIHNKTKDGVRIKRKMTKHRKKMCTCTVCGKIFSSPDQCRNHMYFQHEYDPKNGKGLPYTCMICKKRFAYKSNTNAHVRSVHPDEFEEARAKNAANIYANLISVEKSLLAPKSANSVQGRRGRPSEPQKESYDDSDFEDSSSLQ